MEHAITPPPEIEEMAAAGALFALSHSGGKDSRAMTILRRRVIPRDQLVVVHAPLGRAKRPGSLRHIRQTAEGPPLILARARIDLLAMVRRRGRFPTPAIRQCTSDLKRGPIERELRRHLRAHPRFEGRVVSCMGLRADESASRARRPALAVSARGSRAGRRWLDWLPVHHLSEAEVFATIAAAGERPHWVYARGLRRCSCSLGHHGLARGPAARRPAAPAPGRGVRRPRGRDRSHPQSHPPPPA